MEMCGLRRIRNPEGLVEEDEVPEPGNPTVSSPRAVYSWEPRLIDAIPVGLRRESSSPIPRVQWPRRQFYYVLAK